MSSLWLLTVEDQVSAAFRDENEAKAAAQLIGGVVKPVPVVTLMEWLQNRTGVTLLTSPLVVASAADPEDLPPEDLARQEAEAQAAWLARDRSKDPEPVADLSNVHVEGPGCQCLGCRVSGPIDWTRVVPQP